MNEHLKSDWTGMWGARIRAGMNFWLGLLAAALSPDQNSASPCSFHETGG